MQPEVSALLRTANGRVEPPGTARGRVASYELLRLVAFLAIVWAHAGLPFVPVAAAALPVFVGMTVFFSVRSVPERPRQRAVRILRRLLDPWLFWSGVFLVAKIGESKLAGKPIENDLHWTMILTGTKIHLWFLPYGAALAAGLVLLRPRLRLDGRASLPLAIVLLIFMAASILLTEPLQEYRPLAQWIAGLPGVPAGLLLITLVKSDGSANVGARLLLVLAVWVEGLTFLAFGHADTVWMHTIGISCIFLAARFSMAASPALLSITKFGLGVYASHQLFLGVLGRAAPDMDPYLEYLVTVACSFALSWVLSRTVLRWAVV